MRRHRTIRHTHLNNKAITTHLVPMASTLCQCTSRRNKITRCHLLRRLRFRLSSQHHSSNSRSHRRANNNHPEWWLMRAMAWSFICQRLRHLAKLKARATNLRKASSLRMQCRACHLLLPHLSRHITTLLRCQCRTTTHPKLSNSEATCKGRIVRAGVLNANTMTSRLRRPLFLILFIIDILCFVGLSGAIWETSKHGVLCVGTAGVEIREKMDGLFGSLVGDITPSSAKCKAFHVLFRCDCREGE